MLGYKTNPQAREAVTVYNPAAGQCLVINTQVQLETNHLESFPKPAGPPQLGSVWWERDGGLGSGGGVRSPTEPANIYYLHF